MFNASNWVTKNRDPNTGINITKAMRKSSKQGKKNPNSAIYTDMQIH
jgi:hypothetical protein